MNIKSKGLKCGQIRTKKKKKRSHFWSIFLFFRASQTVTITQIQSSPFLHSTPTSPPLPPSPHSIKLCFCHKSINIIREWQTMGWWRQPLSVKAQTALSLSQPGREGQEETETHTNKRKNNMEAEYIHTKPQIHTGMLDDQTASH